jgi:hypothetical protein
VRKPQLLTNCLISLRIWSLSATTFHTLSALDTGTSSHINIWPAGAHVFALSGRAAPGAPPLPARLYLVLERACADPSYVTKSSALLPCPHPAKEARLSCAGGNEQTAQRGLVRRCRRLPFRGGHETLRRAAALLVAQLVSQGAEEELAYSSGDGADPIKKSTHAHTRRRWRVPASACTLQLN